MKDEQQLPASENGECGVVFVVEDDLDISRLIAAQPELGRVRSPSFSNGNEVVSEALREKPSLFLLDIMLPGVTGFEICRQIRHADSFGKSAGHFLTARTAEEDRVRGFELGGDDYIGETFSPRELVARVRSILRFSPGCGRTRANPTG